MSLPPLLRHLLLVLTLGSLLSGCVSTEEMQKRQATRLEKARIDALAPSNAATYQAFRVAKGWRSKVYRDEAALALITPENLHLQIIIGEQRGLLMISNLIGLDFPVSTGRKTHPTPTGDFKVLAKEPIHHSNLYGKILDAEGNVVVENAEAKKDLPGEGRSFSGAAMPFFMRLTNDGVGLHGGVVPGYAASHGCVRLPKTVAPVVYKIVEPGTPVSIVDQKTS